MSFGTTLNNGVSAMRAAQAALAVTSQNIANANTPGYVRVEANFAAQSIAGKGAGVVLDSVTRVADKFLAASYQSARGAEAAASINASLMDRMQALFGDPNTDASVFGVVDDAYRALAEAGVDPASPVMRREAVAAVEAMFSEFNRIGQGIESLRLEADTRLSESVARMDEVLSQIHQLNTDVAVARGAGGDSTGAENIRSGLVDELSGLIDIRVAERADGKLEIRTQTGFSLVGLDRVRLSYETSTAAFTVPGQIQAVAASGERYALDPHIRGGELAGLIEARDRDIPGLAEGLGMLADSVADELNRLHSVQSSAPPPRTIDGRETGLIGSDAHGFSGVSVIAVLDERGVLRNRLTLDFNAGEIRRQDTATGLPTVVPMGATVDDVASALNTALAPLGASATFADGAFSLRGAPATGFAFAENESDPSKRAGRGFSHFFGLNEIARRPMAANFETGLRTSDAHGFVAGGQVSLRARDETGRIVAERTIAVSGTSVGDMLTALNAPGSGGAPYGGFQLDANGRMQIVSAPGYKLEVTGDTTQRGGAGGPAFSTVFGLEPGALARRAMTVGVNPEVTGDPRRLAVAKPNLNVDIGTRALEAGDGRGASALSEVRNTATNFAQAGEIGAHRATLGVFAARLGSEAGRLAVLSQRSADGAAQIAKVATERRASVEGVSIDDEVIRMNSYQQAYAAAARVIQATNEMWQTLLAIR